jgi:DnaJ-class molecular chaperone
MAVDTELYDILGVKPDVSDRELKKGFEEMARKWHPDTCPDPDATEKFQRVREAYHILKDPQSRQTYDRFGPEGLRQGGGLNDILSHPFGRGFGGIFGSDFFGGGSPARTPARGES